MPPLSNSRQKRLANEKKTTEAQEKKTTEASSIKKPRKPGKRPAPGPRLYLRGLNLNKRFCCGHVGCLHMGSIEKDVVRHMRVCKWGTPAPEKES